MTASFQDICLMLAGNNGIADSDPIWITNAVDGLLSTNCGYPVGDIKAARQVASRSNNMPLETLPDCLSEATHQELDKAVEKTVEDDLGDVSELSSNLQYGALLNAIIEHSNGHLDTKYLGNHEAKKLFNTHGELRDMLRAAWKHKSYREIRNIGVSMTRCNLNHIYITSRDFLTIPPAILKTPEPPAPTLLTVTGVSQGWYFPSHRLSIGITTA
ncbi:hypothetical protein OG21DRAFT_907106 [Imleria badia]|nr:hypothetical protein OG21DRAFT_907106 [Imleria badia]